MKRRYSEGLQRALIDLAAGLVIVAAVRERLSGRLPGLLIGIKSVKDVLDTYRENLVRWTADAIDRGTMSELDLRRAHRALLRTLALPAYLEGMREGGIENPEEHLEDEDREIVEGWLAEQLQHVNGYAKAVLAATLLVGLEREHARDSIFGDRLPLWIRSMESLAGRGFASARANELGEWVLGATEEHCSTCLRLSSGAPHRLSWYIKRGYIPQEPGSPTLECGGWRCDCEIRSARTGQTLLP